MVLLPLPRYAPENHALIVRGAATGRLGNREVRIWEVTNQALGGSAARLLPLNAFASVDPPPTFPRSRHDVS